VHATRQYYGLKPSNVTYEKPLLFLPEEL